MSQHLHHLNLPALTIAPEVNRRLSEGSRLIITAPPGAGKSTVLPLTILEGLPQGKILMLEPRRLAARAIAQRMASLLGERIGETVGYRIRFESKVSQKTRIEVITEGILTRMLLDDPSLEGVSVLIFDEFHERSLASDEALALARQTQLLLREDLRIVIMSATIDATTLCRELNAPLVQSEGRLFPIDILHTREEAKPENVAQLVARTIRTALQAHEGDLLAFLPGEREIRQCQEQLSSGLGTTKVFPLYGMLPFKEQQEAIAPSSPGQRKVVLATPIAETSLTIEGVRIVVDSGFCRKPVFDPGTGLSRLETVRISADMATQRSGRAGRLAPGVCYRLWSLATETMMSSTRMPEILEADLSPLLLDVAAWGEKDILSLPWITPPGAQAISEARTLLLSLGAIDERGALTAMGRKMASLPSHPRISRMLLGARGEVEKALAADIAALLEERDPLKDATASGLDLRIQALRRARSGGQRGLWARHILAADQYCRMARCKEDNAPVDPYAIGALLASAYPERIGRAWKEGHGRYLLADGSVVTVAPDDPVLSSEWLVACDADIRKGDGVGRVFLSAPVALEDLRGLASAREHVFWDRAKGAAVAQRELRIGVHLLEARPLSGDSIRPQLVQVICEAARKDGASMFDFSADVENLQRRIAFVAVRHPEMELPDISAPALLESAPEWLPLYIGKAASIPDLKRIDLAQVIWGLLGYQRQQEVERLAPSHITVPTGSRIDVEYRQGADAPILRVRLQECFGLVDTPRVDGGKLPVVMELLSPGYKPVQLTSDLRSFWESTYFEVRKELRRRYPKHAWPDNPLDAMPVRGVKR